MDIVAQVDDYVNRQNCGSICPSSMEIDLFFKGESANAAF